LKKKGSSGTLLIDERSGAKKNPNEQFCPNKDCAARGKMGEGNITIHSRKERRYKCTTCGRAFSEATVQALVKAFGLDDETVRDWMRKAGGHCEQVHEHFMETTELDLEHVQADEIKVKKQCGWVWMGLAMMFKRPIPPFVLPKRRGRPPKLVLAAVLT